MTLLVANRNRARPWHGSPLARVGILALTLVQGCAGVRSAGPLPAEISVDDARSVCVVPIEPRGELTLVLEGIDWRGWEEKCRELIPFLRPGPPPYDGRRAVTIERLLEETGYFELAICEVERAGMALECNLDPRPIVKEISFSGRLPVGLLREDLERRLLVSRGAVIVDRERVLRDQRERLELFLEREGYFESEVTLATTPIGGAEPNLGVALEAHVEVGRTARLRDVVVEGDHPLEEGEVESRLRRFGLLWFFERRFRPDRFQADLDELTVDLQESGWPEARVTGRWTLDPEDDYVDVVVSIDAGPRLALLFIGNEALGDAGLAKLSTFGEAGIIDETEMQRTLEAIERAYQEAGYPDARIESESDQPDPRTIRIAFLIDEGERARVRQVSFEGNEAISSRTIRREVDLLTRGSRFIFRGRWVEALAASDEAGIRAFYESKGHGAAEVFAERIDRPDGDIDVVLRVVEGPRRTVETLTLAGIPEDVDEEALAGRLDMRPSEAFIERRAERDKNEILATLASNGYPLAQVTTIVDAPPAEQGGPVYIEHLVYPGTRAVVGGILVRGNFRTRRSLIEEQLELAPGETLDLVSLGEARRRLRGLGAFSAVEIEPLGLWLEEPETWQVVALQERPARTADLVAAYATDEGFSIGGDYRDRNLLGRAIHLDLRLRLGDIFGRIHPSLRIGRSDRANINLRAPRPFGAPFDAETSIFYRFEDQPDFLEERLGVGAGLSRQLLDRDACRHCPDIVAQLRYEVTAGRLALAEDVEEPEEPDPRAILTGPRSNVGRVAPLMTLDRRDSFVDPRRGWAADARLELAHAWLSPLPDGHNFVRALLHGTAYLDLGTPWERPIGKERFLGGPVVLATSAGAGAARPLRREPGLPASEALYYGGDYSVRGLAPYASAVAFPGARYRLEGGLELRWYVARNVFLGSFQLAGFVDAASVSYGASEILEAPVVSVGPLVRYITPVGPLSLGWGVAVLRPSAIVETRPDVIPERGRLHLTFGYSF